MDYVISGLDNKYTQPSCSKAFSALCIDNAEVLSVYAPEIIQNTIPMPAPKWSVKQHYMLILDGVAALVEEFKDD